MTLSQHYIHRGVYDVCVTKAGIMSYQRAKHFSHPISSVANGGGGAGGAAAWSVGTFTIFVGTFGFVKNIKKLDLK